VTFRQPWCVRRDGGGLPRARCSLLARPWPGLSGWRSGAHHRWRTSRPTPTFTYLLIPTTVAFAGSGAIIGWHEEKLEQANRELGEMAVTDALTGLKNLRYFRARLSEEHARYLRTGEPLALAIIDLDRFKRVNDEFGHQIGDRLLTAVGLATAGVARHARVRVAVGEVVVATSSGPIRVTASVGIASTDDGANAVDELYGRADEAPYVAKRLGRDRIACLGRDVATQGAPA